MIERLHGQFLLALLLVLAAAGCAFPPWPDQPPPTAELPFDPERGSGVTINTWRALRTGPTQAWQGARTRLYTYVLVGDIPAGASMDASAARAERSLSVLLQEVEAGQQLHRGDDPQLMPAQLALANQYCIPAKGAATSSVNLESYDRALASSYLSMFKLVVEANDDMARSLAGPGPFLVALRKPLPDLLTRDAQGRWVVDSTSPVLLLDMSGRHERTMPVFVTAFQESIRRNLTGSSERLRPLSPAIASFLIDMGQALPVISEAYAGTRKLFE